MFWITVWRIAIFCVCVVSFFIMTIGYQRHRHEWNKKTRDYWYGRVMWILTGVVIVVEGFIQHSRDDYSLVFVTAASLATLKGNLQKGTWGNHDVE